MIALLAPLLFAAWRAVSVDSDVVEKTVVAFFWPGIGLYAATLAVLWGGWKIDLE